MCSSVCGLTSTGTSAPVGPGVPLEVLFPEQFPLLASRMADMQRQLAMLTGAATRTVEWTRAHRGNEDHRVRLAPCQRLQDQWAQVPTDALLRATLLARVLGVLSLRAKGSETLVFTTTEST